MVSLKSIRRLVQKGVIFADLYWKLKRKRLLTRKQWPRVLFSMSSFTEEESCSLFRFTASEIQRLLTVFKIPPNCKLNDGQKFTGHEGLCILLRRLAYPNRLTDLELIFKRNSRSISKIFNWILHRLFSSFGHLISKLLQPWLTRAKLQEFSTVCSKSGSLFPNIVGFIDGTGRPICRPSRNQKEYYSGYKKQHLLKYQSVIYPNGIIGRLDGPFKGRRHDTAILHLSNLISDMEQIFVNTDGTWYSLYGDSGYSNQRFIKVGFRNFAKLTDSQKKFNSEMSALRVSVEYGFGKIIQQFAFLDFKKNQKVQLQYLRKQYIVGAILTNCHTCLRGSQVSMYFDCQPPKLEEYVI